jgi:hypothetical protein
MPLLSPRWIETKTDTIQATIRYAPSKGYVSYRYIHVPAERKIKILATTGGKSIICRMLLPDGSTLKRIEGSGMEVPSTLSSVENSHYAEFTIDPMNDKEIMITY